MLVLSRRPKEVIVIGDDIKVTIISVGRDQVRIGVEAPADVPVHRLEVYQAIQEANRLALVPTATAAEAEEILKSLGTVHARQHTVSGAGDASSPATP